MKDKYGREIEKEEQEFYGIEDYELEQRRMEHEDWMMDISRQDLSTSYDK